MIEVSFSIIMTNPSPNNLSEIEASALVHVPILCQELMAGLQVRPGGHYLDATLGTGGHSQLILAAFPDVRLTAIDRDAEAIAVAATNLAQYDSDRLEFWQGDFADFEGSNQVFEGIIADLGVSSPQLDLPERGFSFQKSASLDMRMDRGQSLTAAEIVNSWDEKKLADTIYRYGEERLSPSIARQIVRQRPFHTTTESALLAFTVSKTAFQAK